MTETHNQRVEREQIADMKTGPDRLFLYVRRDAVTGWEIITWPGTRVSSRVDMGQAYEFPCWGCFPSIRRAVRCTIYGVRYVGWYFQSSGDYCRLKRAA